jgi:hypothetical protein
MKFTMNGKRLKEKINICLLKGKYNQGMISTKSQLGNEIKITTDEVGICIENADSSTYIKVTEIVSNEAIQEGGSVFVNAETMCKYLLDERTTFTLKEGVLLMSYGTSVVQIPCIERHGFSHVIGRFQDMKASSTDLQVTEKLLLQTKAVVNKQDMINAMNMAEKVGNSIYTIRVKAGGDMIISSDRDSQMFSSRLNPIEVVNRDAIACISLPLGKALEQSTDDEVIVYYDDDMPFVFKTNDITIMRAPRLEV